MRRIAILTAVCGALSLQTAPPAGAATDPTTRTIRWSGGQVTQIGSLRTTSSRTSVPTLSRAITAFGRTSSRRLTSANSCEVSWARLGLRGSFANFGGTLPGQTTCTPSVGKLQTATIRGRGLRTQRGLRVGDTTARLKQLHSGARFRERSWWLATAPAIFGDVEPGQRVPIVRAITQDAKVARFVLQIGAAGE